MLAFDERPASPAVAGQPLPLFIVRSLFWACAADPTDAGRRDAAILALLYGAGLDAGEVVALEIDDYDGLADTLSIGGAPGAPRRAYLAPGARPALEAWLAVRHDQPGPLFYPLTPAGELCPRRLRAPDVRAILQARADQAAIGRLHPRDLQATFVADLLTAGISPHTVRALTAAAPEPADQGDLLSEQTLRAAIRALRVPYRPPVGEAM